MVKWKKYWPRSKGDPPIKRFKSRRSELSIIVAPSGQTHERSMYCSIVAWEPTKKKIELTPQHFLKRLATIVPYRY